MARKLPLITPDNASFWQGGEKGKLMIHHCANCPRFFHPPAPICPHCLSEEVQPQEVSGRGIIVTYTVNYQKWDDDTEHPFVIAIVELLEQPGLRFVTNIVETQMDTIQIDMPVEVTFTQIEDVWLPEFRRRRSA